MSLRSCLIGLSALLAWPAACSGRQALPTGPAPEYRRPELAPWDAGQPVDPFATIEAEGEWVDDEPDPGEPNESNADGGGADRALGAAGAAPVDGESSVQGQGAVQGQGTDARTSDAGAEVGIAPQD